MLRFALVASAWKVGGFTTPMHVRNGALLNEVAPLRPTPGLSRCSTRGLVGGSTGSGRLDGTWHADNSQEKSCNSFQVCGAVVPTNLTSCTSSEGGNTTKTYVLGPFTSHGGYDWWHLNFDAPQDDLYMLGSWSMTLHDADASDPAAAILGLPPLHMHHIFDASSFVEHTGDNQCTAAEEGYPDTSAWRMTTFPLATFSTTHTSSTRTRHTSVASSMTCAFRMHRLSTGTSTLPSTTSPQSLSSPAGLNTCRGTCT